MASLPSFHFHFFAHRTNSSPNPLGQWRCVILFLPSLGCLRRAAPNHPLSDVRITGNLKQICKVSDPRLQQRSSNRVAHPFFLRNTWPCYECRTFSYVCIYIWITKAWKNRRVEFLFKVLWVINAQEPYCFVLKWVTTHISVQKNCVTKAN